MPNVFAACVKNISPVAPEQRRNECDSSLFIRCSFDARGIGSLTKSEETCTKSSFQVAERKRKERDLPSISDRIPKEIPFGLKSPPKP